MANPWGWVLEKVAGVSTEELVKGTAPGKKAVKAKKEFMEKKSPEFEAFQQKQQELLELKKQSSLSAQAEKGEIERLRNETLDALRAQQAEALAGATAGTQLGGGARLAMGAQAAQSGAMAQSSINQQFLSQQQAARDRALKAQTGFLEFGAKLDMEKTKKMQDYSTALAGLLAQSKGFMGVNKDEYRARVRELMANEPDPAVRESILRSSEQYLSGGSGVVASGLGMG
tara:strand:+ start:1207 stop:1893 length:687 start_codon:yes stop_codon:yes gene_type:complete